MVPQAGMRVRARGLTWEVLTVDHAQDRARASLRCIEGDMVGLEWEIFVPPDQVDLVELVFNPERPVPLETWRTMHRSHQLSEIAAGPSFRSPHPGRVRVEPYQLVPLLRALDMPRPRLLLADGVGLGKTIQAGLIAVELIARGRAHRILIVVPSGMLPRQWDQEMRLRFGLGFTLITSAAELWDIRQSHELGGNPFDVTSLCITTLDFAKQDHVLAELERSEWDLVIIDEAHHCVGYGTVGPKEATYRRLLAEVLSRNSDGLLLLTATPHDGHDEHFGSLIGLLDPSLVDGTGRVIGRVYRRHVIRRMKTHIRNPGTGGPMFRSRRIEPVKVSIDGPEYSTVREFHLALTSFVLPRLRRGKDAEDSLAFVSLLKRSVSTICASVETLRVIAERVSRRKSGEGETGTERRERARALRAWRRRAARFGSLSAPDEANQTVLEIESMAESLRMEPDGELSDLIRLGSIAEADDPKLAAMVLEIKLIRLSDPVANILIYTEYTDSQAVAARIVRSVPEIHGEVLTIGGQDEDRDRALAAHRFSEDDTLILISTDSLAEGLNLQKRCCHLIHLDLPYNPNRLEQRNGRIDRYGQQREPEIRYLYIAGTFEESLLLRLIAKYEAARSHLDVMPDTLGVTASPEDYEIPLTRGLSEPSDDLFRSGSPRIHTMDRAVESKYPERIGEVMHEIDRAFDAFDLMAVCHGWYGLDGFSDEMAGMIDAERVRTAHGDETMDDLVIAVIASETGTPAAKDGQIRLPPSWAHGLEDLPGFDRSAGVLRFTREVDTWRDADGRDVEFLGRSHPLVRRAIRHGRRLEGAVAIARGDSPGLLLTFEIEICLSDRSEFRQVVAISVQRHCRPLQLTEWITPADSEETCSAHGVWDRIFAPWAQSARTEAETLAYQIAHRKRDAVAAHREKQQQDRAEQLRLWTRVRADQLCGTFVPPTGDLFGAPKPGFAWRHEADSATRLILLATHADTVASKRREANDVLAVIEKFERSRMGRASVAVRPIGMLMLVPDDS